MIFFEKYLNSNWSWASLFTCGDFNTVRNFFFFLLGKFATSFNGKLKSEIKIKKFCKEVLFLEEALIKKCIKIVLNKEEEGFEPSL